MSDAEVRLPSKLGRARNGNGPIAESYFASEWRELYDVWYFPMVQLARLLAADLEMGDDIAQDAFVRLFEKRTEVQNPELYLRGTVVNLCRRAVRRAVIRRRWLSDPSGQLVGGRPDISKDAVDRALILQSLRSLSPRQREVVVFRYFLDLKEDEIAAALKISVGSVKAHRHRAIGRLRSDLGVIYGRE